MYALGPLCALLLAVTMVMLLVREVAVSTRILSHTARSLADGLPAPDAGLLGTHATLLLPGVTIAWTVLPVLLAATALAVIIHEAGHVMAAIVEGIPVISAGLTTVFHVLPAAHVTLDTAALAAATPMRRMRVAAAGMLHNVLLALVCAALSFAAHRMLAVGYVRTRGVVVRGIAPMSDLAQHLPLGALITGVGICPVTGLHDWPSCVHHTVKDRAAFGFCMPLSTARLATVCLPTTSYTDDSLQHTTHGCRPSQLCAVQANTTDPLPPMGWCTDPDHLLRAPRCTLQPPHNDRHAPPQGGALLCGPHAVCVQAALPPSSTLLNVYYTEPADRASVAAVDPSHPMAGALWGAAGAARVQRGRPVAAKERPDWPVAWPPPPPRSPAAMVYSIGYGDALGDDRVAMPWQAGGWNADVAAYPFDDDSGGATVDLIDLSAMARPMHRRPRRLLARPFAHEEVDEYGWQTFRVTADEAEGWGSLSKSLIGLNPPPSRSSSGAAMVEPPRTWWQLAAQQRARQREVLRKTLRSVRQHTVLLAGPPTALLRGVFVDEWEPLGLGLPDALPSVLLGCIALVARVSMALAMVNALPIAGLDGHVLLCAVGGERSGRVRAASVGAWVMLVLVLLLHVVRLARAFAHALVPT